MKSNENILAKISKVSENNKMLDCASVYSLFCSLNRC